MKNSDIYSMCLPDAYTFQAQSKICVIILANKACVRSYTYWNDSIHCCYLCSHSSSSHSSSSRHWSRKTGHLHCVGWTYCLQCQDSKVLSELHAHLRQYKTSATDVPLLYAFGHSTVWKWCNYCHLFIDEERSDLYTNQCYIQFVTRFSNLANFHQQNCMYQVD